MFNAGELLGPPPPLGSSGFGVDLGVPGLFDSSAGRLLLGFGFPLVPPLWPPELVPPPWPPELVPPLWPPEFPPEPWPHELFLSASPGLLSGPSKASGQK